MAHFAGITGETPPPGRGRCAVLAALVTGMSVWGTAVGAEAQGRLRCAATDNGSAAEGEAVIEREGERVASGRCGQTWRLPPGAYEVRVTLDGALDAPTVTRQVRLARGATEVVQAEFDTGALTVDVEAGGRQTAAMVEIRRGDRSLGRVGAGVRIHLSTGRYVVVVRTLDGERRRAVEVRRGEHTRVTVAGG